MSMMSVLEYALDVNKSVGEVINKLNYLGFDITNENDELTDEMIIELDNEFQNEEVDDMIESDLEDTATKVANTSNIDMDNTVKKQKLKKKDNKSNKEEYSKLKKDMYKHKEKLTSNTAENENVVLFKEGMTVSEFAAALNVNPTELIKKLIGLGMMLGVNNVIDYDTAEIIALDYKKELKSEEKSDISNFEEFEITDDEKDLTERPAVVTIMGHVDHGKTTLLDTIRNANVVSGEAGGITQHIGAYQVEHNGKKITFIDTPGHAAFTEMRARGASVTDIVIIIVAADDGVMPQTREAVDHAKAAGVPIIVAVNKIDKPEANVEKVMTGLTECGLTPEEWGGDTLFVKISAKTGDGIDELLENILLISEMEELKANPNRYALGSVIESKLDKNVGSVVTILIQNGTLRIGDPIVVGTTFGKIRTLKNDRNQDLVEALPSTPVTITGLNGVPSAGDRFMAFETEKEARNIAEKRSLNEKEKSNKNNSISLEDLFSKIQSGTKEINVVLKTDVKGSEEAVKNSLLKIDVEGAKINVIRSGVGTITESDVVLANASHAIIIGFNVRPSTKTSEMAKEYSVDIRLHNIIYKVVEEMEAAMKGMLDPEYEEHILGHAEIRKIFKFSKVGNIAGSYVTDGVVKQNSDARLIRDGIVIYEGKIASIQREKDQAKEVKQGFECGITLENYSDIKENDVIECFENVEIKR
ncbi:MAG: translation initiation factor IF-2 [Firmicutes bacterium]|nr:translation initiation factor IF-2 [Bacillota bacterium]